MPRKGVKRSDRRWIDEDGSEWDSQFECRVFHGLRGSGHRVRRCDQGDTIAYNSPVKQGGCLECGSDAVIQNRIYTADLFVVEDPQDPTGGGYLVECKGYFAADKRSLFRSISKQIEGTSLRIIFESPKKMRGTKLTGPEYIHKYCKNVIPGVYDKKTETVVWHER